MMPESSIDQNNGPPDGVETDATNVARKNVRKALDWLLVPAAAGAVANVAVVGLSSVIGGGPIGGALVAAAVIGTAIAKYIEERPTAEERDDSK
jgi:hypothetical protein